jgi:hypothetical protein
VRLIPRETAALHEAGHVVVSLATRTGVRRVQVIDRGTSWGGLTSYRRDDLTESSPQNVVKRRALTTLGGIAAEWAAAGRPRGSKHEPPDVFAGLDFVLRLERVEDFLESKDQINERFVALVVEAADILEERWRAVESIAAALLVDTSLGRSRILALSGANEPTSRVRQASDPAAPRVRSLGSRPVGRRRHRS